MCKCSCTFTTNGHSFMNHFSNCKCFVTFYDQLKMWLGQTRALQANGLLHAHSQLNLARLHEAGAVSL